jgi:hypothetical protein
LLYYNLKYMDRIPLMQNNRVLLGRKKTSNVIVTLFVDLILLLATELNLYRSYL